MTQAAAIRHRLSVVSPLERRLREWGLAYGARLKTEREPDQETALYRAGVDRSRIRYERAKGAGQGYRPTDVQRRALARSGELPGWVQPEPIRCVETRTLGSRAPDSWAMPSGVEEVESAVLQLHRWDTRAACALRASYCLLGRRPLSERIAWAVDRSGFPLSRMGYRAAVARGRVAVSGALKITG